MAEKTNRKTNRAEKKSSGNMLAVLFPAQRLARKIGGSKAMLRIVGLMSKILDRTRRVAAYGINSVIVGFIARTISVEGIQVYNGRYITM